MDYTATTNKEEIKNWIEKHSGKPAKVEANHENDTTVRINFPGSTDEKDLTRARPTHDISWDEFFKILDQKGLAFIYYKDAISPVYSYRFIKRIHLPELEKTTLNEDNFSNPDALLTLPSHPVDQELNPPPKPFGLDTDTDNETLEHAPSPEVVSEQSVSGDTPDPSSDDDTTQNAKLMGLLVEGDPQPTHDKD